MKNTKQNPVGRPVAVIKYPRGVFTINQLVKLNPVCPLTIRKHVDVDVAGKVITMLSKTLKTGEVGKPANRYSLTARGLRKFYKARKARSTPDTTPVEVPVEVVASVPVEVVASVPVEVAVAQPAAPAPVEIVAPEATPAAVATPEAVLVNA